GNNPCILVMDEPTSALSREEVDRLFSIIEMLRKRGIAIVYISHHLPELNFLLKMIWLIDGGTFYYMFPQ
ncbi:MAG: sugar ABC transporter ATP-binding protein, partial [Clostridiales bacterium]|nr:sugar ABC transporter ATP-binding protein [Clostridiales bacterium]